MKNLTVVFLISFLLSNVAFSEGDHNHSHESGHDHVGHKDEYDDNHAKHDHSNHDRHDEHSEVDSHEGHNHDGSKAIGKGKAIELVDEENGFKLSQEAIRTLKIKLQNVEGAEFEISKPTLVTSKGAQGVYRFRAGFFKLLEATILKETTTGYRVRVNGVNFGDQIVVNGVGLLRVTDVYSTDKSEYGHSH